MTDHTREAEGLKPCPFCGGGADIGADMTIFPDVACDACGASVSGRGTEGAGARPFALMPAYRTPSRSCGKPAFGREDAAAVTTKITPAYFSIPLLMRKWLSLSCRATTGSGG